MKTDYRPLADLIRPQSLKDFVGQEHLTGQNGIVSSFLHKDFIPSMIFWGPPGSGKTTLAKIIANQTTAYFLFFSAVTTKKEEIIKVIKEAQERLRLYGQKTILFLDEIHRFNKAQQASFLRSVEDGSIILIGATTENPSFEIISPLLSRTRVLVFKQLEEKDLKIILKKALKKINKKISLKAENFLIEQANGDGRILLNVLEIAGNLLNLGKSKEINEEVIEQALQSKQLMYDKAAEEHFNTISAFIKSMRASDENAALYYLSRMIAAGEDPLFIARRMVVFASEDIGMAQPTALVVANEVFSACHHIGYPECSINLAHGVVYLARAKKDRSAYNGFRSAQEDVLKFGNLPIPLVLRNPVTKLMKNIGYGQDYQPYPQKGESLLPDKLKNKKYLP